MVVALLTWAMAGCVHDKQKQFAYRETIAKDFFMSELAKPVTDPLPSPETQKVANQELADKLSAWWRYEQIYQQCSLTSRQKEQVKIYEAIVNNALTDSSCLEFMNFCKNFVWLDKYPLTKRDKAFLINECELCVAELLHQVGFAAIH